MTLQEAFTEWAAIPQNSVLAAKCRSAMESVLLKQHGSMDVREFTAFRTRKIMDAILETSVSVKGMKIRSASILVQLLSYAAQKGACLKPDFDYTIANTDHQQKESTKLVHRAPRSKNAGKPPVSVVQLDPRSYKVVGRFGSISEAGKATGADPRNISKAVMVKGLARGFYWCRQGDEETFKPGTRPRSVYNTVGSLAKEGGAETCSRAHATQSPLSDFSDAELKAELEHRGWYGTLYQRLDFEAKSSIKQGINEGI